VTLYGVEIVEQAVKDARENALRNGIENARYEAGETETIFPRWAEEGIRPDVIVVDPPRKGCHPDFLQALSQVAPERIVYVSCNPATLARDAAILADGGYRLDWARPVDMFPHTTGVETVCLLSKLNTKQHIEVDIHMDELDLTDAEKKATYGEIKEYVLEHTGLKVSSLYIAQVKQKYGIIERENYNKPKSEDARQPQCPPDKEKAIKEALLHFGMI
jgi:23S rRNA (uracil1939-C5)-methyltransferase